MQSLNSPRKISETTVELLKQYNFNLDISVFYIFISLTFYVMTGFEIGPMFIFQDVVHFINLPVTQYFFRTLLIFRLS